MQFASLTIYEEIHMDNVKQAAAFAAIKKARARLVTRHPFFGCLALGLELEESTVAQTLATDGTSIFYNVDFTLGLTIRQLASVIAHEVLHVAMKHHLRRGKRDPKQWNVAADYAINGILIKSGLFNLPDGGLFDKKYDDWGAEKIYADLPEPEEDQPDGPGGYPGPGDDDGEGEGEGDEGEGNEPVGKPEPVGEVWDAKTKEGKALSPSEVADVERQIDSGVQEAARAEKSIGQGSSDVTDGILKGLAKIDLPWHEILKDYLLETSAQDYSWSNPNRRFVGQGLYLPGPASVPNGELVFAIDVSCSLEKEELENIAGHINEIVDAVQPLKTYVIYCDTTVKNPVAEFELGEDIELKYYRGGGTAFAPPFNWCLANDISPSALVYFTDGYGSVGGWPELDEEPDYPVVWATSGTTPSFRGCNEFGEVIEI